MKNSFCSAMGGVLVAAAMVVVSLAGVRVFADENDVSKVLQARVAKLTPEQQAALLKLLDQMPGASGDKAAAKVQTPEEAMQQALRELETAKAEKKLSIDTVMTHISKNFDHDGTGKDGARDFIQGVLGALTLNGIPDIKVSLEHTKYTVLGDKSEVSPVEVSSPIGSVTVTIYGKLEDGVWRVIGEDGI